MNDPHSTVPAPRLDVLLAAAKACTPVRAAIIHPVTPYVLAGLAEALRCNLVIPVLVGPTERILAAAAAGNIDISNLEIVHAEHSHAAASTAVGMAKRKEVAMLVKGGLSTDELMHAVLHHDNGIRTERRISHAFVIDSPAYHKLLVVTDAAINIEPDLAIKRDIVQNAIDLMHCLKVPTPKVALLSAQEFVNPNIHSTIDAAALCKMADRGQIRGAILDGPLALDNAISADAARTKGIVSAVAGDPDILMVPELESGNMLAKQFLYFSHAMEAGIVLGARVPIVLTSRSDGAQGRLYSTAIGVLCCQQPMTQSR